MKKNKQKVSAGRLGGMETKRKHGCEHYVRIGKQGAAATHERYSISPFGLAMYAMVHRETGVIKALIGQRPGSEPEGDLPWQA